MGDKMQSSISKVYKKSFEKTKKKTDSVLLPTKYYAEQAQRDSIKAAKRCNDIWNGKGEMNKQDNLEAMLIHTDENKSKIIQTEDVVMKPLVQTVSVAEQKVQCTENLKKEDVGTKVHVEQLSMSVCAKRLLKQVKLISMDKALYYFNGYCYQMLDKEGLIELYRDKVDDGLHDERGMRLFAELHEYLLTDSKIRVKPDEDDISSFVVLKNGVYDLRTKELKRNTPNVIAFSYVNASFVKGEVCPRFDSFLNEVTGGNEVLIERMWMALGYILTQSMDAKAFFVMGQAPNSGKSLFGHFIQNLYDSNCISAIALSDMNGEFSLGQLVGKAVNVSLDLPHSKISVAAVSKLKMLTGGDLITVNEKYQKQFKYQNRAKFIFASNHPIQLTQDDDAFWDRLVFLPFDYSVSKELQNENLLWELLEEKDAVVSKALKYARRLMKNHYQFPTTPEIEKRIRVWRGMEIDTINDFVKSCCSISSENKGELMEDLYQEYIRFCADKEECPVKKTEFKRYLEDQLGLAHCKMRRENGANPQSAFRGIQLYSRE